MTSLVRRHALACYFVLAYALTWSLWLPLALTGQKVRVGGAATHFPGLLGPMIAALAVTAVADGRRGLAALFSRMGRWRVGWGWAIFAAAGPLAVFALVAAITGWPNPSDLGLMNGAPDLGPIGLWLLLLLVNGFGEETGWRGFALDRLLATRTPLVASLLLSLGWAGWHAPSFFFLETYQGFGAPMLIGFVLGLTAGSVFLTWLYLRTGRSVLMCALWHASFNLVTATVAARGAPAAVASTLVMLAALFIAARELSAARHHAAPR